MGKKNKITATLLQDIEDYARDEYSLLDAFTELNISTNLLQDEQISKAYEKGLIAEYIYMTVRGIDHQDITKTNRVTMQQCEQWAEDYKAEIEEKKSERKEELDHSTKQFSNLSYSGLLNVLYQNGTKGAAEISQQKLKDDLDEMIEKIKNGDMTDLLTVLTTNLMQMQLFNGQVTGKMISTDSMKSYDTYSRMQMKILQESRKTVICINEIVNPKRTTFVKTAEQHNYINQDSEKKDVLENEKQEPEQLTQPDEVTEAEVLPLQEKAK